MLVSIHLMCRFKFIFLAGISKPPSFNTSYVSVQVEILSDKDTIYIVFQYILCVGSSEAEIPKIKEKVEFQYILCVGSRITPLVSHFSYFMFQYILCVGSSSSTLSCEPCHLFVSIHLMCRFKSLAFQHL